MKKPVSVVRFTLRGLGVLSVGGLLWSGCSGTVGGGGGGGDNGGGSDGTGNRGTGATGVDDPIDDAPVAGVDMNGDPIMFDRPKFTCDDAQLPAAIGLRKLTTTQYTNTIRDLFKFALGTDADAMAVMTVIKPALDKYPKEERQKSAEDLHGSYRQLDQDLQQGHVDSSYEIALAAGAELSKTARLSKVAGTCATDSDTANDAQCITDFINKFGERALRRPLTAEEATFYRTFYGTDTRSDPLAWTDLIGGFLTAPQFLYTVEHGGDAVANKQDMYKLSPYEMASRLSYHFLQTMPDSELLAAAKSGALLTDATYQQQVDRLMDDPRARIASKEFFTDYLKVDDLAPLDTLKDRADFKTFAGGNVPSGMLRQAMIDDAVALFQHNTWSKDGTYADMFTNEQSFAQSKELADIYKVGVWDGQSEPPLFPAGERPGFLTRGAFLASGLVTTRPIMKGVFIRNSVLCDAIPPPDNNAQNTPVDTTRKTTREAVELITEQDGSACAGCHVPFINPLGFATEGFDSIGRLRSEEMLFDKGAAAGTAPVNTTVKPRIFQEDETQVTSAGEMMGLIAKSGKPQACVARNYFRFTFARFEDDAKDGCLLEQLRKSVEGTGSMKIFLREVAFSPEFKQRLILQ